MFLLCCKIPFLHVSTESTASRCPHGHGKPVLAWLGVDREAAANVPFFFEHEFFLNTSLRPPSVDRGLNEVLKSPNKSCKSARRPRTSIATNRRRGMGMAATTSVN